MLRITEFKLPIDHSDEQLRPALLAHLGLADDELLAKQLLCLRLAVLLCHARRDPAIDALHLSYHERSFTLSTAPGWARQYPQSAWLLEEEVSAWQKTDWKFSVDWR